MLLYADDLLFYISNFVPYFPTVLGQFGTLSEYKHSLHKNIFVLKHFSANVLFTFMTIIATELL